MKRLLPFFCFLLILACKGKEDAPITVENDGNKIATAVCGDGDTTLLFIHGWCINKEYWDAQVKYFCPRYKVVTIDLPGFGQSGKKLDSTWSFDRYSGDVSAVIKQLKLSNVILIGHSMSGDIILDVSRRFPENIIGIVGIDNLHQPAEVFNDTVKAEVDNFFDLFYQRYDSVVNVTMSKDLFQPSTDTAVRKRVMGDVLTADKSIAVKVLRSNTIMSQQQKQVMAQLHHPLLLLNSDVYPVNADSLKKYCVKGFRVKTVHGSGHYPMIEMPDTFNKTLEALILAKD